MVISRQVTSVTAPNGAPLPEPTPWAYPFTGVIWKVTADTSTAGVEAHEDTTATITNETAAANATGNMTSNETGTTLGQPDFYS